MVRIDRLLPVLAAASLSFGQFNPAIAQDGKVSDTKVADAKVAEATKAGATKAGATVAEDHAAKMAKGIDLFKKDVRPILIGRCLKCHGGNETMSDLDLSTREGLMAGGIEGPSIKLGDAKGSRLYRLVAHLDEPYMPEDGAKLTDIAIEKIAEWIELGAPYDNQIVSADDDDPTAWTARGIEDDRREFWSFRQLRHSPPPEMESEWVRTDIDHFILATLRAKGLVPCELSDRRRLIRRAYFDLLGIPPAPADVESFVNDPDPRAYDKLVDRLLASEHYGERWGRHWLDIARFAESHGFEQDYDRPHAYHYRDFVIKALNSDMPYDQFVRWQLAGDEFEPDDPVAMMATGFLGAGVFPTQLTEKEFEPARYDELDDIVATFGTAMLGLTVGCARCHDHKFDPIPSADYYRLVSSFTTTIRSNVEMDLNPERTRQQLEEWNREHAPLIAAQKKFEADELPARFATWRESNPDVDPVSAPWVVLDLVDYASESGASLTKLDDGSLLASGANPDSDKYKLVAETSLVGITSIRLEALAHDSFVKNGPGRASNGNIGLSRIRLVAAPLQGDAEPVQVKLFNPRATFQQNAGNLAIAASLDNDKKSGWAVDPQFGKDHAAAFDIDPPIGFDGGTRLTFTLEFDVNTKHNIGRPRLSVSNRPGPVGLSDEHQPQQRVEIAEILNNKDASATQLQQALRWYRSLDDEWLRLNAQVAEHLQKKPKATTATVMVVTEGQKPIPHHADGRGFPHFYPDTHFLNRGDSQQKQGVASQSFLQVLMPAAALASDDPVSRWREARPGDATTSYRRRTLANWVTDTDQGAGNLLARVIANRMWQHHFGRGIVSTPNDLGYQGDRPTHPELLEWLAARLVDEGWRLKPLHKLMMTSSVYMQGSSWNDENARLDPDNQRFWRFQPRRLEAEIIRDAMLVVSGQMDETMFGPGSLDESMKRRSIYFMIKRSRLVPMMQILDSPEPLVSVGNRPSTTIAPQALMFMNNRQVREHARAFATRLVTGDDPTLGEAVHDGYLRALARPPSADELNDAVSFLRRQTGSYANEGKLEKESTLLAMTDFCQVLMSLNEFVYVD